MWPTLCVLCQNHSDVLASERRCKGESLSLHCVLGIELISLLKASLLPEAFILPCSETELIREVFDMVVDHAGVPTLENLHYGSPSAIPADFTALRASYTNRYIKNVLGVDPSIVVECQGLLFLASV